MQGIFEGLLEVLTLQNSTELATKDEHMAEGGTVFLERVARQLLGVAYTRKGRGVCFCVWVFVCVCVSMCMCDCVDVCMCMCLF